MPLLRQLEFAFRSTGILSAVGTDSSRGEPVGPPGVSPGEFGACPASKMPASPTAETAVLLQNARELLRSLGAAHIAGELHVEWNSRLKTAAGRADCRQKLISLNPQLVEHPTEIDRTLRHELAHILAQFRAGRRRIPPRGSSIAVRIVVTSSRGSAVCAARSPVLPAAANTTAASSICDFGYGFSPVLVCDRR